MNDQSHNKMSLLRFNGVKKNVFNHKTLHSEIKLHKGFTIIELVLVIVLMGILAVSVAPKMFNSDGFEEYAYQAEVIATLRSIQLRAMQQTSAYTDVNAYGNACHTVVVTAKKLTVGSGCNAISENSAGQSLNKLSVDVDVDQSVSFSPVMSFIFDAMGRPINCNTPCVISINGNDTLSVMIEAEGFIHAQ